MYHPSWHCLDDYLGKTVPLLTGNTDLQENYWQTSFLKVQTLLAMNEKQRLKLRHCLGDVHDIVLGLDVFIKR